MRKELLSAQERKLFQITSSNKENTRTIQQLLSDIAPDEFYYGRDKACMICLPGISQELIQSINTEGFMFAKTSNQCPTLTANMGTGGHNVPLIRTPEQDPDRMFRKLTPKECFYSRATQMTFNCLTLLTVTCTSRLATR